MTRYLPTKRRCGAFLLATFLYSHKPSLFAANKQSADPVACFAGWRKKNERAFLEFSCLSCMRRRGKIAIFRWIFGNFEIIVIIGYNPNSLALV